MITIAGYHRWGAIIIPLCSHLGGNALSHALPQQISFFLAEKADFTVPLLGIAGWKTVHERFAGRALGSNNGVGMLQQRDCPNTDQSTRSNKEDKEEDDKEKEEEDKEEEEKKEAKEKRRRRRRRRKRNRKIRRGEIER